MSPTKLLEPCVSFVIVMSGAAFCRFFGDVTFENNIYLAIDNDGGTVR